MERKKIALSILQKLNEGNKKLSANEYGIDLSQLGEIVEALQNEGLISGVIITRGGFGNPVLALLTQSAMIEIKGMEYLEKNL